MSAPSYDFLIVGAGFAGAVCARELAERGNRILLIDRRPHIGGNAYDMHDEAGLLVHPYGPHIFHTNSDRIFGYLSRFTSWRPYEHRVLSQVDGQLLPFPINRTTVNRLYGLDLTSEEVGRHFEEVRIERKPLRTSEDLVLASVGRDLCDKFYRGYTRKQWDLDLSELATGVAARIPVRTGDDDRYFTDRHQAMPADGYTRMFENILDDPRIEQRLSTSLEDIAGKIDWGRMVYTGPIDAYYGHRFGRLAYRSLRFEHKHLPGCRRYQPVAQVNYPNDHAYTRITEFKYLTGQEHEGTSIVREYPAAEGEPFYPVPQPANEALFQRYKQLAAAETRVTFVGRLAEYRYYNMDQVVGAALAAVNGLERGHG